MRLGTRARVTVAVGLVSAAAFAALGVRELVRPRAAAAISASVAKKAPPSSVLFVATTRAIRTGETITADMVRNVTGDPARFPGAATPNEVIGHVAVRDIPHNTVVSRNALVDESKLAIRVPVGMRAVSIDTTAEIAVAGLVRPGDKVDVQVVYPGEDAISGARGNGSSRARTLLQLVPVLAVGEAVIGTPPPQSAAGAPGAATAAGVSGATASSTPTGAIPARTVTLALTPEQVAELSLAKNVGTLTLSLRNPEDGNQVEVAQINSSPVSARAARPAMASAPVVAATPARRPAVRRVAPPKGHAIDLVVGGNREVIYSGGSSR